MGHTLVTRFSEESFARLQTLLSSVGADRYNKIPFGRDCDREKADEVLPYHVTMLSWAKNSDALYLPRLDQVRLKTCAIRVTGVDMSPAEEGSWFLYLDVQPGSGFEEMRSHLQEVVGLYRYGAPHITVAIDKDRDSMTALRDKLRNTGNFPIELEVSGLDLYHIWRPTKFVRTI